MVRLKDSELHSELKGNQIVVYALTKNPLLSLQCYRDFGTRKLACNVIDFK